MAADKIEDPVLGVLLFHETFGGFTYYRGETQLTPKHLVVIEFKLDPEDEANEGLAIARAAFQCVRRDERRYRIASAAAFLANVGDVDGFFGEPGWTPERVAGLLTLARVDVTSTSGLVRLIYSCKEGLGEEDLAVTFDDEGNALDVEDPYR
jgi:hypothetical protein